MKRTVNRHYLKDNRKALRNNMTSAEIALWMELKGKQLKGYKFRRQHSVGNYIIDFYCADKRLAIELDGADHFTLRGKEKDKIRETYLSQLNIKTIRFENKLVFQNMRLVLEKIEEALQT